MSFVNRSNVPVAAITFSLTAGKYTQSIVDKGTFNQGVPISHNFSISDGLTEVADATVNVADVEFADGGAWHAASAKTIALARATTANATTASMPIVTAKTERQTELDQNDAEARHVEFRHLGTSL